MRNHAEMCPVCGGSGKLSMNNTSTFPYYEACHGCGGLGWVSVKDGPEYEPIIHNDPEKGRLSLKLFPPFPMRGEEDE